MPDRDPGHAAGLAPAAGQEEVDVPECRRSPVSPTGGPRAGGTAGAAESALGVPAYPGRAALDVAGSGVLPELIELAGGPEHVVTIADFGGAQEHGVTFSSGDAGRAVHALAGIGELIESGRFSLPVARTFPLAEIAEAHRVSEDGHVRGKLVLLVG